MVGRKRARSGASGRWTRRVKRRVAVRSKRKRSFRKRKSPFSVAALGKKVATVHKKGLPPVWIPRSILPDSRVVVMEFHDVFNAQPVVGAFGIMMGYRAQSVYDPAATLNLTGMRAQLPSGYKYWSAFYKRYEVLKAQITMKARQIRIGYEDPNPIQMDTIRFGIVLDEGTDTLGSGEISNTSSWDWVSLLGNPRCVQGDLFQKADFSGHLTLCHKYTPRALSTGLSKDYTVTAFGYNPQPCRQFLLWMQRKSMNGLVTNFRQPDFEIDVHIKYIVKLRDPQDLNELSAHAPGPMEQADP